MTKIVLSDFVELITKAGLPKATAVSQIKNREEYNPAHDFYKILKDSIIEIHQNSLPKSDLKEIISKVYDKKRRSNYPKVIEGYKKWWGKKELTWFKPETGSHCHAGIEVSVNPDIGLNVNGDPHIIKLYFKGTKLTKPKVDIITGLMENSIRPKVKGDVHLSLLDVRNSKLFTSSGNNPKVNALIDAELAFVSSIWGKL